MIFNIYYNLRESLNYRIMRMPILRKMCNYNIISFRKIFSIGVMLLAVNMLMAQDTLRVTGVVLSGAGHPVSDVAVSFQGSAELPVITGESGEFSLLAPSGEGWLMVAPVRGFKERRIFLNNRERLTIYLTPEDVPSVYDDLEILSVDINKRDVVGSFAELNLQDIHHTPAISIDQYMEGRIPGMHVINLSGTPGSGALAMIRGVNSTNANNQPLYVVDGIPVLSHGVFGSNLHGYAYNPLLSINPFDISKVTVVKDPVIGAAYGSRGSNGIIFIETLDPAVTETTIDLDIRGGYSLTPPSYIPQLNAHQHKTLMNEVLFSSPIFEENIRELYPNLFVRKDDERFINYQHNTSWQELIYRNSVFSNINLTVKGGDEIARYGLTFGYLNSEGTVRNTGYEGYNLRFVSRLNMFTWLRMNAGVALNYSNANLKETTTINGTSPVLSSLAKSPLLNPYQYDLEGRELIRLSEPDELSISNPLATVNNYEATNDNTNFTATLNFEATVTGNFFINSDFGLTYNVLKESIFMPMQGMARYYNMEAHNAAKVTNNTISVFYNNSYARYTRTIGNHRFISNTGVNIQTNHFELDWGSTMNAHENDRYRSIQHGQNSLRQIGGQNRTWNWISVYEYLNYSFLDRYLLSASISIDGSSRVGRNADNTLSLAGQPFGLFYGVGAGWRISGESFLRNVSWLEELKLRASYGRTGNDDIGEASATRWYQTIRYRDAVGLYPATMPNDRLTYETVTQLNAGLDVSFLGGRIAAKADYFISNIDNMLIFNPINPYFGYDVRMENGGSMENTGWEFSTFARIIDGHSFKWDVHASLTHVQNQVTSVRGDQIVSTINGAQLVNRPGHPANSFYGYVFEGVYTTTQEATEAGLVNNRGMAFQAGDAKFADISGPNGEPDGIINDYDKTIIGTPSPDYFGGLMNSFRYGRWGLSGYVQFVAGNDVFNYVRYQNERMAGLENQSKSTLNRWQYEGHQTDVPRALWNDPIGNSAFSTRWIEDASYIRLKNITLSYRIPSRFLAFQSAEFYFSANNIFVFSDYLGYDPEFAHSFSSYGIDYGQPPIPRQFMAGIKFGL
jgi:TonB-linked SusC/RagA family outer membrane protein